MLLIKSVMTKNEDVLKAILALYCPNGFDLDPTYSVGGFYKNITPPTWRFDVNPSLPDVRQADSRALPFGRAKVTSIVFDPPFMFGEHGQTKNNKLNRRFTMFPNWAALEEMYRGSLKEFYRILQPGGILAFKCQDYTDSKTTLTHCKVANWAEEAGFKPEDLFILVAKGGRIWNPNLKQKHARKFHCYWFVFRK